MPLGIPSRDGGEKSSLNRIWLSTAVCDYHTCPAEYPAVNEVPTLRATNMYSPQRACCWPLECHMHRCFAYHRYACILYHNSSIIITAKGLPLTQSQELYACFSWRCSQIACGGTWATPLTWMLSICRLFDLIIEVIIAAIEIWWVFTLDVLIFVLGVVQACV